MSKIETNSSMHIGHFGRIAYMEPQILANPDFQYIKSSDIYSYGVLMWEISSGYPPFNNYIGNDDIVSLAVAINRGTREATILDTPKEYEELYKRCWGQEPEKTIKEVLEEFLEYETLTF